MVCFSNESRYDPRWCIKDVVDSCIETHDELTLTLLYEQLGHERNKIRTILGRKDLPIGLDNDAPPSGLLIFWTVLATIACCCFLAAVWESFYAR